MNAREINELMNIASGGDRKLFEKQLSLLIQKEADGKLKFCERTTYRGIVRPTSLIGLAGNSPISCFYDLTTDANPTKVMGQISSEIKRAEKLPGVLQSELVFAYIARTGVPFKAIKVTYSPPRINS